MQAALFRALPFLLLLAAAMPAAAEPKAVHALAMLSTPKYGPDFAHFDYVNPEAPKGGALGLWAIGTYDSLNPFILKGAPAAGVMLLFDTLTAGSLDEPFSEYGLLAESIEVADDRSWVAYNLRPEARWQDGQPVTPEDVVFSFDTLTQKGHPRYRAYYANVAKAEKTGERQVRFTFSGPTNRELPLIMGQLPILPKHYYEKLDFEKSSLEPPLGSGPYKIKSFDPGRSITLERVPDYWGAKVPVNVGRYNYDIVRYEYYRDFDVALEAFKAGQYDLRFENSAKRWSTGYVGPAFDKGLIKTVELPIHPGARMQGWVFNIRRAKFQDSKVRQALGLAFDFEWSNKTLMYGQYVRLTSYFDGEPALMGNGVPDADMLALLTPFKDRLPPEVFTQAWTPPRTDGSGNIRDNLRKALGLLREAGWEAKGGVLTNTRTGEPMAFEILSDSSADERLALPFAQNLERLGVKANFRVVDPAQYQQRTDNFDYDMIVGIWGESPSPGNEQRDFWGSAAADVPGSQNSIGIKDPVVDAMIDKIIHAEDRHALEVACRALDRVLLWGFYVVPHFVNDSYWTAYWDKLGMPAVLPSRAPDQFAWWIDAAKEGGPLRRQAGDRLPGTGAMTPCRA